MMRSRARITGAGSALALALGLGAQPLAAQSVSDYRLPGATSTPNPRAQGPVDPDAPVVRTSPQPTAAPSAAPTITPAPVATAVPTTSAAAPVRSAAPSPRPSRAAAPTAAPQAAPGATVAADPAVPAPVDAASGALAGPTIGTVLPSPEATPEASEASASSGPGIWPWLAGAMAVLAALFAVLWWWRGRADRAPEVDFEPPVVRQPDPAPAAPPRPVATPEPAPAAPQPRPEPALAVASANGLDIALQATRMSASLMATTLNYRLVVTNRGNQPLSALAVEGDMVSAHSSLPPEKQIANDTHRLELRHALVELAPGESAEFSGDFRLPLTEVTPIRAGDAAYFVPLARLRVEASTAAGSPLISVQTFVVGELPENPGAALRPFRLDLGPRTYSRIGQRAVS